MVQVRDTNHKLWITHALLLSFVGVCIESMILIFTFPQDGRFLVFLLPFWGLCYGIVLFSTTVLICKLIRRRTQTGKTDRRLIVIASGCFSAAFSQFVAYGLAATVFSVGESDSFKNGVKTIFDSFGSFGTIAAIGLITSASILTYTSFMNKTETI